MVCSGFWTEGTTGRYTALRRSPRRPCTRSGGGHLATDLLERSNGNLLLSEAERPDARAPAPDTTFVDEAPSRRCRLRIQPLGAVPAWLQSTVRRLEYLLRLPDDWDSHDAVHVDPRAAGQVVRLLAATMRPDTPPPTIVPTPRGGVQLEWHYSDVDLEIEVPPAGALHVAYENTVEQQDWEADLRFDLTRLVQALAALPRWQAATAQSGPEGDPLAAARERGRQAMARLLKAEGGTLSAADIAARLNVSTEEVDARRRAGRLVAVEVEGDWRYPAWQIANQAMLPGIEEILPLLHEHSPWDHMIFFLNPNVYVGGVPPLVALREGRLEEVRRAAQAHGEQGAA
jgi:hypothetical protein